MTYNEFAVEHLKISLYQGALQEGVPKKLGSDMFEAYEVITQYQRELEEIKAALKQAEMERDAAKACLGSATSDVRLARIHELIYEERRGNVVVLPPLRIGDCGWTYQKAANGGWRVVSGKVTEMYFVEDKRLCIVIRRLRHGEYGKDIFTCREDAERRVAELNAKNGGVGK